MHDRYMASIEAQGKLMDAGLAIINPLTNSVPVYEQGFDFGEKIYEMDLEILRKCSCVIVLALDGWRESKGVRMEIEAASEAGMLAVCVLPGDVEMLGKGLTECWREP